ncbi:unnamed protein product [Candidula unifasciata]|uniref:Uncharacterized protein n=1 Tax=Candidula unifasciata TaxID=100452 RepID=A0A8S4A498_9EUPU|nr:unnamed protein product [Candidula unifasciata]
MSRRLATNASNAPWHKLEDEISHSLAQKAEKQFSHPHRKEMLLEVLGPYFVEKYLTHIQRKPEVLELLSSDERNRLRTDAENWLNVQMYKAVRQTGHGYLLTGIGPGEPPPIGTYAAFLQETFSIFTTGLDRELYIQEQKSARTGKASVMNKQGASDIYKVPAPSRLKPVPTDDSGNSQLLQNQTGPSKSHMVISEAPPLWGPQSDLMGSAVVSLLQRDPRKFEVVVGRLHGRQLPGSLRTYIWADVLFKAERQKMKEVYVEKVVRERFAVIVTRGLTELRIKKPTQSPINGLIQNAVIETYSKTISMIPYKQMEHIKETIKALNVLYVYDRSYEPYLVHWLFPLQLAFRNKEAMMDDKGEHVLELAMYLDMLSSNCFPSWPHVFAMAEQVMMKLQQHDPDLYTHLKHIAPINAQVNPKEFLVHLLYQEREKADELLQTTSSNTPRAPTSVTQFLTDPTIFLRRWIGEDPWLADVKPENLRLNVSIYFGSIKIRSRLSHSLSVMTSQTWDGYGSLNMDFEFPGERHIYDMIDISPYDVERELGAYPNAIFRVECIKHTTGQKSDSGPVTLGWSRIPLYRHTSLDEEQLFALIVGDVTVPLHPGAVPESFISAQPQTPTEEGQAQAPALLGYSCTLSAFVFDPNNEPADRKSGALQTKASRTSYNKILCLIQANTQTIKYFVLYRPTPRQPIPLPQPPAKATFQPSPRQNIPEDTNPWTLFKSAATKSDPKPTSNRDPFVLYIDSVRYLPDSATIVKVTGRILRAGDLTNLQDILAVPDLDSPARSPAFNFSMLVNEGRQIADPELLLFLRLYTFDMETQKVVVIGSALVRVFNPSRKKGEGLLNVGGHQLRLHSGIASDLDNNPIIPGCSFLIRLLPQMQDLVPAPDYSTGYYKSEGCKPTASELRLFASYAADNMARPKVERDVILRLQQYEKPTMTSGSDAQLAIWLINKLDIKKQQGVNQPAGDLPLHRCVRYRIQVGLNIQIKAAFGLPDGLYIQCFAHVAPGKQAKYNSPTSEGFGKEEKFITTKLAPGSHLTAPVWEDGPKKMNPFYDSNSCLIIQLFGLKVLYRPQADHKSPGMVQKPDGTSLVISKDELIGWTVVPLFEGNSVISGTHTVPVLTCPLNEEMMDALSEKTAWQALNQTIWNNYNKIPGASIEVRVWDAHFDFHELPKVEDHQGLLEVVGGKEQYLETARAPPSSITQQEFLLGMLEEKVQRQGLNGSTFKKEFVFFHEEMAKIFTALMADYCLKNGFAPVGSGTVPAKDDISV